MHLTVEQTMHGREQELDFRMADSDSDKPGLDHLAVR